MSELTKLQEHRQHLVNWLDKNPNFYTDLSSNDNAIKAKLSKFPTFNGVNGDERLTVE